MRFIIVVVVLLLLGACDGNIERKPIAKIGNEFIYMETVDSLLGNQLNLMRENALQSLISIRLMKLEADKMGLNHQEYKDQEIFQKSKKVKWEEATSFALRNGIVPLDSSQWKLLREQRKLAYRKSRHAVLIDSLRRVYQIQEFFKKPHDPSAVLINELESQVRGAPQALAELHIIFDYNCGHCLEENEELEKAFAQWGGLVKFNYVYYAPEYSEIGQIADALAKSGKFWQAWPMLTNSTLSSDEIKKAAIEKAWIGIPLVNLEGAFQRNKNRLTELGIYSVPTYILNGSILPSNTSTIELLDYLYSQLSYEVEKSPASI